MASTSIMESLFQRTLEDLIKGLRVQMIGESKFIAKAMDEIRREIKSTDLNTKSTALQKLTYLNSLHGLDMSWAAFHAVEVMSSPRFPYKKIGYVAASQSFHDGTDVILLITNQIRKDLTSTNEFEVGLALECLSVIATPDLSRDLSPEIYTLLSSSKISVRKKAIAVVLRIFNRYPDAVRVSFKRLVENLECSDPHVVSAAIGVFCELTARDPKSYLPLAPEFYRVLVDSKNNWVLIKVLKIFAKLAPLEPRLAKRVVDPICEHMRRSGAKSLVSECVRTVVSSLCDYDEAVKLAVEKIRELLLDEDANLKYLGLNALSILGPKHLWAVVENKEIIIKSLSDGDPNIKLEALRLIMGMVSESNVTEMSRVLIHYAMKSDPEFCNEIFGFILSTCSRNVYEIIIDFDWYVSLLGEMSRNPHCRKGDEIERQLIDIGFRVKDVRPQLVHVGRDLLIDPVLLGNPLLHKILSAAAWISGEYVEFSRNPFELMEALLQPRTNLLPPLVRAVYIQSAFKVLVFCLHSYLVQRESIPNLSSSSSDLATCEASANFDEHGEMSTTRLSKRPIEDIVVGSDDSVVTHELTSSLGCLEKEPFTYESIICLLNLIKMAVGPLLGSDEVELQERARNLLGLIHILQEIQEGPSNLVEKERVFIKDDAKTSEIVNLMYNAFSKELGPVSVNAQERVTLPDGLILNDNLTELDTICGDILQVSGSISNGSHQNRERDNLSHLNLQRIEEPEPSSESTSLLAQHRKRHGLYYLPAERDEIKSDDYPPANDPHQSVSLNDAADDLVKLTEQSLVKKKLSHVKPRPVVVKLDEGHEVPIKVVKPVKESKDDLLSDAVRDILLGDESKSTSSRRNMSDNSSKRRVKERPLNSESFSQCKENSGDTEKQRNRSPNYRRQKHRSHGKEVQRSPRKSEDNEGNSKHNSQKKSSHHHSRQKTRQRADGPLNVVPQAPVIQDFLL